MKWWGARLLALIFGGSLACLVQVANAACVSVVSPGEAPEKLLKHLPASCTQAEREAEAVSGASILDALEKGQSVELVGVIVRGDISFDRVPVQKAVAGEGSAQKEQEPAKSQELRLIRGALLIRDSVVAGAVRHRSDHGQLRFDGAVDFRGTTFQEGVDLSRSIFHGPVELAGAVFQKEAYFIQGQFLQAMNCTNTKFGPHTRFHRSTFHGPVDCAGVLFDGLAEWLEVTFEKSSVFERARFGSGTGFSGSRFMHRVSFEEAIFSSDAFFTFSLFNETAVFAGAQFLGPADFSNADFRTSDDLGKARFDKPPLLTHTKRFAQERSSDGSDSFLGRHGITLACVFLAALLLVYIWKV